MDFDFCLIYVMTNYTLKYIYNFLSEFIIPCVQIKKKYPDIFFKYFIKTLILDFFPFVHRNNQQRVKWVKQLSDLEIKDTAITPDMQSIVKVNSGKVTLLSPIVG